MILIIFINIIRIIHFIASSYTLVTSTNFIVGAIMYEFTELLNTTLSSIFYINLPTSHLNFLHLTLAHLISPNLILPHFPSLMQAVTPPSLLPHNYSPPTSWSACTIFSLTKGLSRGNSLQ